MKTAFAFILFAIQMPVFNLAFAQTSSRIVDIPTRPKVTQRFVFLSPDNPKAAVILFAGGHGGLQVSESGSFRWGEGNFLVRTRQHFADKGLAVAIIDAPSDLQRPPFLSGFRQTAEHVADVKAVIAWLKQQSNVPVWLVGTSRGTQSAAYVATQLAPAQGGPDGLVLTSAILADDKGRPVIAMPLERLSIPVLVVHHEQDACKYCSFADIPRLMEKLPSGNKKELIAIRGGTSRGDPCEAFAHHGFNGMEDEVVGKVAAWVQAP